MGLRYEKPKEQRIKNRFFGMTTFQDFWMWDEGAKKWTDDLGLRQGFCSSHCDCNSVRAFRRRLKTAPKNVEFILVSRYKGYDVYGINNKQKS